MTTVDLIRIAKGIIPPSGATAAIARVDRDGKHRAAFLIAGRIHGDPIGPSFDRPRDAIALVRILNGEAPRPRLDDSAGPTGTGPTSGDARVEPEAPSMGAGASLGPSPAVALPPAAAGACAGCGGPLPLGRHGQRRLTCSDACRQRAAYRRAAIATAADADGARPTSHLPGPSEAVDHTSPSPG